jgi:hypothetical protein
MRKTHLLMGVCLCISLAVNAQRKKTPVPVPADTTKKPMTGGTAKMPEQPSFSENCFLHTN